MTLKSLLSYLLRFIVVILLFGLTFITGAMFIGDAMPTGASEPGLVPSNVGLLITVAADALLIAAILLTSRWGGWKLALALALAYYGAVTFLMHIETWYFLTRITVGPELLPRLFLMGLPPAFIAIPLSVWILGKGRAASEMAQNHALVMPVSEWAWKLALIVVAYLALYWGAGYFIAWQNPELRAFYGQPGAPAPFFTHLTNTLRQDPLLFPFQIMRALLWTACALPIIRGSKVNVWWTALLVGMFFSLPQNIGHINANPLLPIASVRLSHLIETASSTFVFGLIVVWLLHRRHASFADLAHWPRVEHPRAVDAR